MHTINIKLIHDLFIGCKPEKLTSTALGNTNRARTKILKRLFLAPLNFLYVQTVWSFLFRHFVFQVFSGCVIEKTSFVHVAYIILMQIFYCTQMLVLYPMLTLNVLVPFQWIVFFRMLASRRVCHVLVQNRLLVNPRHFLTKPWFVELVTKFKGLPAIMNPNMTRKICCPKIVNRMAVFKNILQYLWQCGWTAWIVLNHLSNIVNSPPP